MWTVMSLVVLMVVGVHSQSLPSPSITANPSVPTEGQNLTLTCVSPSGVTASVYQWLKDFGNFPNDTNSNKLTFSPVTSADSGSYQCQYGDANNATSDTSQPFEFSVGKPDKPELRSYDGELLRANGYFALSCESSASDIRYYNLFKDGTFYRRQGFQSFNFNSATKDVSGTYTCTVTTGSNSVSDHSEPVSITVIENPKLVASNELPDLGTSLTLSCTTDLQMESQSYIWSHNYNRITSVLGPTYTISNLTEQNEGLYTCRVSVVLENTESTFETGESNSFILVFSQPDAPTLQPMDLAVRHSESGRLSCSVATTQSFALKWAYLYFNGEKIAQKVGYNARADFEQNMLYRDMGNYTCTLSNKKGESRPSDAVTVSVTDWTPGTRGIRRTKQVKTRESNEYLICGDGGHAEGIRYCTIYIDGHRYQEDEDCSFAIPHSVTGSYTCSASSFNNTSAQGTSTAIRYIDAPTIKPTTKNRPVLNQSYSLECITDATDATFSWYSSSNTRRPISTSKFLTFANLNTSAQSSYFCRIRVQGEEFRSDNFHFYFQNLQVPQISTNQQQNEIYNVLQNFNSTQISCYSNGAEGYTLYRDGQRVGSQADRGYFHAFLEGGIGAKYSCSATTVYGESQHSQQVYINGRNELVITASPPLAVVGQDLTLTCSSQLSDMDIQYRWLIYIEEQAQFERPPLRREGQTLTFNPVTESNAALYVCQAQVNGTALRSTDYYMIILQPPEVPEISRSNEQFERPQRAKRQTRDPEITVTIMCYCRGLKCDPKNPFRLYKDGVVVNDVFFQDSVFFWGLFEINRQYHIDISQPGSSGNYTCTSLNAYGESAQSDVVEIHEETAWLPPVLSVDNPGVTEGGDITFTCGDVPSKIPDHYVFWHRNGRQLIYTGPSLKLHSISSEDDGYYYCSYINRTDDNDDESNYYTIERPSNIFTLTMLKPLQPLLVFDMEVEGNGKGGDYGEVHYTFGTGENIPLRCYSQVPRYGSHSGRVPKTDVNEYRLLKDGQPAENNNPSGHFIITGLPPGLYNYTCQATNRIGDSPLSYDLLVSVTDKPSMTASPASPTLGNTLTLTCNTGLTSDGFDVIWKKNGKILPEKSNVLQLDNLSEYDEGDYVCRQKNASVYLANSESYILVFGTKAATPQISTIMPTEIEEGMHVTLHCLSTSTTSSMAVFYRNGNAVATVMDKDLDDAGQILFIFTIFSADQTDGGDYTCAVENTLGQSDMSQSLTITILGGSKCFAGFYRTDSGICSACDYGTYQPDEDQTSCLMCPAGLFTLARGATAESQCVTVPDARKIYLRITVDMTYDANLASDVSAAIRDTLASNFRLLPNYAGILTPSVMNGASGSNEVVVIVPLVYTSDVSLDMYNFLGFEIYSRFYTTRSNIMVAGSSYNIKTLNMFVNEDDAMSNSNVVDFNECSARLTVCSALSTCTNLVGSIGSFTCDCVQGYQRLSQTAECTDIDECLTGGVCTGPNEKCVNIPGNFVCDCIDGFTRRTPQDDCSNFDRSQLSLYPYGTDKNDSVLSVGDDTVSSAIVFDNGLPFGTERYTNVYVSNNGMISVGATFRYWYWGDLSYRFNEGHKIICPFMTDIDTTQGGQVVYQLYKKSTDPGTPTPASTIAVLQRAISDVLDNFGISGYDPKYVLVATWVQVKRSYYRDETASNTNMATFQAVIITNGITSYVIFMYKSGEFQWPYIRGNGVSVGYVSDTEYVNFVPQGSVLIATLDQVVGNKGRFGTWMAQIGAVSNPGQECQDFYVANVNLLSDASFQNVVESLLDCPCSVTQMGRQWSQLFQEGDRICFALNNLVTRFFKHNQNKLCCYRLPQPNSSWWRQREGMTYISSPPDAGFVTLYNPFRWSSTVRESRLQDLNPHRWCCRQSESTKLCNLFYEVRPKHQCSTTAIIISGIALGDPHFTSLDGKRYTFNGLGEYTMSHIPSRNFVIQARTARATLSDGKVTRATVFSAVAAKEGDYATFQVELSSDRDRMLIYANGQDYTTDFYTNPQFSVTIGSDLILDRTDVDDVPRVSATFPSGVEISISQGVRSLGVGVTMLTTLKNLTSGLLGNFNGNPADDFTLPNGTTLNTISTDRQIFEQFGRFWAISQQDSVFAYPPGESAADYSHPEFIPLFREEIDASELQAAENICGKVNDACIFDYVATNSKEFAENTKKTDEQGDKIRTDLVNTSPTISLSTQADGEGRISVTAGQPVNIMVTASDQDGDTVTFELIGSPAGVQIGNNGLITYTPDVNTPVTISVVAVDSKGGRSSALTIPVVVCSVCSGHGQCDRSQVRTAIQEGGNFQKYECTCREAYAGPECEHDRGACADNPCIEGQLCTDTAADQEDAGSAAYKCGPCPAGFTNLNNKCRDIDECSGANPCGQNQKCNNVIGSYTCSCNPGFRLNPSDGGSCMDINECTEKTHNCEHKCVNTQGSYQCQCEQGYTLQADKRSCELTVTSGGCANSQCEQVCVLDASNTPQCSCRSFYQVDIQDPTRCTDVDECSLTNRPCAQVCTNRVGGYECSCFPGYQLTEDMISCEACESPSYGVNCSQTCLCGGQSTGCDPIRGCVCRPGWTGPRCDVNINECDNPDACAANEICSDLVGTYECQCAEGYQHMNGRCIDIDECLDVLTHTCELAKYQVCSNTEGSYKCNCLPGFFKNSTGQCQDIDECATNSHNCQQRCVNTQGGFSCQCYFGYRLDDRDRTKCVFSKDVCKDEGNLKCDHGCTIDLDTQVAECYCNSGYMLAADKQTCIDINECDSDTLNRCSRKDLCVNTPGGYSCSCGLGMQLDNDQRTCRPCEGQTWGMNCMNDCQCSPTGSQRCDSSNGCICKSTFAGRYCDMDVNECLEPTQCSGSQICINTIGGYRCECPRGYKEEGGQCVDIDECKDTNLNNCDQTCDNFPGGFSCSCFTGFTYNMTAKRCYDVDECARGTHMCSQNCVNSLGSYRCDCRDGFELDADGVTCRAISACSTKNCAHDCALINGQETCFCPRGQRVSTSNDLVCEDIDLCASQPCEQQCQENAEGTDFICSCTEGYKLSGDGVSCQMCDAGQFGRECSGICDCVRDNTMMGVCDPMSGSCLCQTGWKGTDCSEDINECSTVTSPCSDPNSSCVNEPGSYRCTCNDGYFVRNSTTGICEMCDANFYGPGCSLSCRCNPENSVCNNVDGTCQCKAGWQGTTCEDDIDECSRGTFNCSSYRPVTATCVNLPGSYECVCPTGYTRNDALKKCEDVNECNSPELNICIGSCTNTQGSYTCTCPSGFTVAPNGRCLDIDECQGTNPCSVDNQECRNTPGGFTCSCKDGYTSTNNGSECSDVDECASPGLNVCEHNCTNTEGSYMCTCPPGFAVASSSNGTCLDIDECQQRNACSLANQLCTNTWGNYTCTCNDGYALTTDGNKCTAVYILDFTLRFPLFEPTDAMLEPTSMEYEDLSEEIKKQVHDRLIGLRGFIRFVITQLRRGSLECEGQVIVDKEINTNVAGETVYAVSKMNTTGMTVNGAPQAQASKSIANTEITSSMSQCELRQKEEPCTDGQKCVENDDGVSVCQSDDDDDDDDDTDKWIGIGIGIGAAVIIIVGVIIAVCVMRHQKSRRYTA